ncbi:MAG: M6 family metalloprotease domain-containing protein [Bacteroidales bacterium]|nr:M6 family metalloprotease domain-containing protein [Bacteroidales bacterium]
MCNFRKKPFIKTLSQFDNLFNQIGYTGNGTGSVRDFFKEASYNQFDLEISLFGIYTAPNSEAYYAGNDGTQNCPQLARWLAQQVDAEGANFSEHTNGTNKVNFHIIFAGRCQASGGGYGTIWSHKWQFSPSVCQGNKCISEYSCSPELKYGTQISDIGTPCHEMTHLFGAADFYDTNYGTGGQYEGTGIWDLMAEGSYNGNSERPAHPNMYVKIQFGWATPTILNTPTTITDMPNSAENPVAYRINTTTNNEYYLIENRQKIKFDASVPGNGLIIYHVHSNVGSNCINCTHPQRMYPVCASRTTQMPANSPSSYGNINSAGCPFPGTSNKTAFTDDSTPAMKSWANANTNKPITNITHNTSTGLISFDFMGGGSATSYTITATCGPNGSITPAGETTVYQGGSQEYTITPNAHYDRTTVLINGTNNTGAVNTGIYTFTNVNSNQTIEANFAPKTYTVTFNSNSGSGTMEKQNFIYGVMQTINPNSFTNSGYLFKNWNTQANGNGTSYNDQQNISISGNITLYAQWEIIPPKEFVITSTATQGGEISPLGAITVLENESQLFTITPDDGYVIIDVLVDDLSVGANSEYLFENVEAEHTIHAIFDVNGIADEQTNNHFAVQVIPNPAHHFIELRIRNHESDMNLVEFYNIFGQVVKSIQLESVVSQKIDISDLHSGIYVIKVGNKMVKLVVQ